MNLGPGKGGGLGWRVHIWDDVTLGRFGYAPCRWRHRSDRLPSDTGLRVKWYQMFQCNAKQSFHLQARFFSSSGQEVGPSMEKL